jgi:hypothetical protein
MLYLATAATNTWGRSTPPASVVSKTIGSPGAGFEEFEVYVKVTPPGVANKDGCRTLVRLVHVDAGAGRMSSEFAIRQRLARYPPRISAICRNGSGRMDAPAVHAGSSIVGLQSLVGLPRASVVSDPNLRAVKRGAGGRSSVFCANRRFEPREN